MEEIRYARDEISKIRDEMLPEINALDSTKLKIYQKELRHIQRDVSESVEHALGTVTGSTSLDEMINKRKKELEADDFDIEEAANAEE